MGSWWLKVLDRVDVRTVRTPSGHKDSDGGQTAAVLSHPGLSHATGSRVSAFLFLVSAVPSYNQSMSSPAPIFRPYERLVTITIGEKQYQVPEGNMLLRALQYLAPEAIAYGRFCWNEECQYCRVTYDMGAGTQPHAAISCKLMVKDGMRLVEMAQEIRYCLRDVLSAQQITK